MWGSGGALALGPAAVQLDAVLDAWYPGMEGAAAIAEVLELCLSVTFRCLSSAICSLAFHCPVHGLSTAPFAAIP